ncbi:MAG: nuclear transport factor 2 family protein [Actinomycetota bacterium]|nr:nuclear transport factor 2 family protein [Actinomycetota bacterium]
MSPVQPLARPDEAPGLEIADTLATHEARAAARRLVAALFDAWDTDDADALAALVTDECRWRIDELGEVIGRDAVAERFRAWRRGEPFSVHWATNEQVELVDGRVVGSWLWLAASSVATTPAPTPASTTDTWGGGDVVLEIALVEGGWRIASFDLTTWFRGPLGEGWRDGDPLAVPLDTTEAEPTASTRRLVPAGPALPVGAPADASEDDRLEALAAESDVRRAVADLLAATRDADSCPAAPAAFTPDAQWDSVALDGSTTTVRGAAAIGAALGDERRRVTGPVRPQAALAVALDGTIAHARWRDLWAAEVNGAARWRGHDHAAELHQTEDGWRVRRLRRTTLLDAPYDGGWQ